MPRNTDGKFFNKARQAAMISDYSKTHVGCVAVYQGKVIGIGCNCNKTHPMQKYYDKYRDLNEHGLEPLHKLHAEINCISQIKHLDINFPKVRLYIYRIRKNQPFGIARPCHSCMAAIRDMGIRHIYYTTDEGYAHERLSCYDIGGVA